MKKYIRNFSIIAHIDHGKSTLSDRIIEICKNKIFKKNETRILDSMELEKERGITIKSQSVCLKYKYKNIKYKLNLIDTPGHIDFCYEVERSLYACEGVLLLIDATQGIEAQTLSNYYIAKKLKLNIIPIINKIDVKNINIENIKNQIKDLLKISKKNIILCSAKTGYGIKKILKYIINKIPYPKGKNKFNLQALVIDSYFDNYLGALFLVKIKNGFIKKKEKIKIVNKEKFFYVNKIFINEPEKKEINIILCGEVGWILCNVKNTTFIKIGNTITSYINPSKEKILHFKKIQPNIYTGIYPINNCNFIIFKKALEKLSLNDSSIFFEPENSQIFGLGFRCGFLGLLHMDITKERLIREYKLNIIITTPNVVYKIKDHKKKKFYINNTKKITEKKILEIKEPIALCKIISPIKYIGKIIKLCINKRGKQKKIKFNTNYVFIKYEIPISEIIINFIDKLKSISNGYASFNYKFKKYKKSNIKLLEIIINKKKIDGLSILIHEKNIINYGKKFVEIIKNTIPKHQFDIIIQSSCNNKIIYKSIIKSLRKNVTSKCYGGDITRKKKLLEKQKKGKKKMKKIGNIFIPQKTFLNFFKIF